MYVRNSQSGISPLKIEAMSVQSRVIPTSQWVKNTLVDGVNAFIKNNEGILRTEPKELLLRCCTEMVEVYNDSLVHFAAKGYPMQNHLVRCGLKTLVIMR